MRRSSLVLGASMLTVALGGGNAVAATPPVVQEVTGTIGAVQVGSVAIEAPVRVASPGDTVAPAPAPASPAAPQSTQNSVGTAQAGSVSVRAPVRVLSSGEDGGASRS